MDQVCPRCKTTKYRNPNMKMMVNVCGHNLCESCVELLFVKGSGSCPECNIPLRRGNFRYTLQSTPYTLPLIPIIWTLHLYRYFC